MDISCESSLHYCSWTYGVLVIVAIHYTIIPGPREINCGSCMHYYCHDVEIIVNVIAAVQCITIQRTMEINGGGYGCNSVRYSSRSNGN